MGSRYIGLDVNVFVKCDSKFKNVTSNISFLTCASFFFRILRSKNTDVSPYFFGIDKSDSEIGALMNIYFDSEIRLCYVHFDRASDRWSSSNITNDYRKDFREEFKV